jgi:hypothetical protein
LSEEVLEAMVVSVEGEMLASLEVMAEDFDGVDDGKKFKFMDGIILLGRAELAGLVADWLISIALVLKKYGTNSDVRSISV